MKYEIILMDPPWAYSGAQDKWGAAAKFYPTMSVEEICQMKIPLQKPGILFTWATGPKLHYAIGVIQSWGLHYRGVAFVWVKTKKSAPAVPIGAQGVRPSIVKPTTEFVLAASNVPEGRPLKLWDESVPQVVLAPKKEHSRKPTEVHQRIESMYPDATKLEMFSRPPLRRGWDHWGNEVA